MIEDPALLSDDHLKQMYEYNHDIKSHIEKLENLEMLSYYASHPYEPFRVLVARNVNTSEEILKQLAKDKSYTVVSAVAENPNSTPDVMLEFDLNQGERYIKELVGQNKNTPQHILLNLVKEKDYNINKALAGNPNLPEEAFFEIIRSSPWQTYADKFIANPNTSSAVLEYLWIRKHSRRYILSHKNVSPRILWLAYVSGEEYLVKDALRYEKINPELFRDCLIVGCKMWGAEPTVKNIPLEWLKGYLTSVGFDFTPPK